ncbi:hypothetical protein ACFLU6_02015 [Acidobacteriota bacterium]
MTKTMKEWFFMREGFETFRLQPEKHSRYLFGEKDNQHRDRLLESLQEAAYSRDGHKAAVYGDYGRGKTHLCHNVIYEISKRALPFVPVYFKCGAFKKKEAFSSLFREMVFRHTSDQLNEVATEYEQRVRSGTAQGLNEIVASEDISRVMSKGLTAPNPDAVKVSMRWLGGEPKIDLTYLGGSLKPQLADPDDFGSVMRGLSHMFLEVREQVPVYIIDEAERFENITDPDTFFGWLACIRELTELPNIGMIMMIGAKTRDELPTIFVQDEIIRRIGAANYVELQNPGQEAIRSFLLEQLQTSIRKGPVPEAQIEAVDSSALDDEVPQELLDITGNDDMRLQMYPFAPDAFDEFVQQISIGERSNKPSEAQLRLQKSAQRAMRLNQRMITPDIVEAVGNEGF